MNELYYSHPVQVRYWNAERHSYYGGIAYHDFIIDGVIGEVLPITKVLSEAANNNKDADEAIIELSWLNLNLAILDE